MSDQPPRTFTSGLLLPELLAARGIAAVWVVLAHTLATILQGHAPLPAAIEYTRIIVDFFFVLSGFVLAHMYDPAWREGRFRHGQFLLRRLARLWPLHMATLLAVLMLVVAGGLVGVQPANPHTAASFAVTALLLHSTWATPDLAWNWPSWSVSAEWCAYLAIPLFLMAADRVRGTRARVLASLAAFAAASALSHAVLKLDLVTLTFDGGAFRIIPSFFAGILLRRIFDDEPILLRMTPRIYAGVVAGVVGTCALLIVLQAPYDALWPPMVVLVAALASRATWSEPGVMRFPALNWLGDLSYSIYLNHAIVLIVVFAIGEYCGIAETLGQRAALGALAPPLTLLASHVTFTLVEKPGRALIMFLAEGGGRKRPAPRLAKAD